MAMTPSPTTGNPPQETPMIDIDPEAAHHYCWDDLPKEPLKGTITRRLITSERMMLAQIFLQKGDDVPRHSHENEQLTYVLSGALQFWLGAHDERELIVRAGEVLVIPSHLPHRARALEDTLDVDVFCPPRQDWLDGTDAYLRS
jgi:quercetin dioxygenase-like cupin family protein